MKKQVSVAILLCGLVLVAGSRAIFADDNDDEPKGGVVVGSKTQADDYDKVLTGRKEAAASRPDKIEVAYFKETEVYGSPAEENISAPKKNVKVSKSTRPSFSQMALRFSRTTSAK